MEDRDLVQQRQSLYQILNDCTVYIKVREKGQSGTGFFVAPGTILTCAHVVSSAYIGDLLVEITYNGIIYETKPIQPTEIFSDKYPDLALLRIDFHNHPCVSIGDSANVLDRLYSFGYTYDHQEGESATLVCEGTFGKKQEFLKLKEGQVKPGSSGSPLLNVSTRQVCGIIKATREKTTSLGGVGIPSSTIWTFFPDLQKKNQAFHKKNKIWADAPVGPELTYEPVSSITATLYEKPGVIGKPDVLFGRKKLLNRISSSLEKSRRVLLFGMAGVGKTSLAATLAEEYLLRKSKPVIWLRTEQANAESIMEALAACCGDMKTYEVEQGDNKILALRFMLEKLKACLLVFDDAENIAGLNKTFQAIPKNLPVLITSRQSFGISEIINVDQLEASDALELLAFYAGKKDFRRDPHAAQLCSDFEYLPYALELCGQAMKVQGRTPKEQRQKLTDNLLDLSRPGNKEENLVALLADWTSTLSEQSRKCFLAFGAFPENGVTSPLLDKYLDFTPATFNSSLEELVGYSLIKRQPETNFYYMHKLTFEYVRSLPRRNKALQRKVTNTALGYLGQYSQDFDLITLDLHNLLSIVDKCDPLQLVEIMSWLTLGGYPTPGADSYFVNKGHNLALLERLDQSIDFCRRNKNRKPTLHYLVGKRGDAFFDTGDYKKAISCYEEALKLAPNVKREVIVASVAARTYAISGEQKKAKIYFKKSYASARKLNDDLLYASVMGQESHAASASGEYTKVQEIAKKQVILAQKIVDVNPSPQGYKQLFFALLNHGTAEMDLAKQGKSSFKASLSILQQAQQVAIHQKSDVLMAYALDSIGEVFHYLKKKSNAKTCFEQALKLWRKMGMIEYVKELETRMFSLGYALPA